MEGRNFITPFATVIPAITYRRQSFAVLVGFREYSGVVLNLHDTTVLDFSGLTEIEELGQVGDGNGRGYYCHNTLAVAADGCYRKFLAAEPPHPIVWRSPECILGCVGTICFLFW